MVIFTAIWTLVKCISYDYVTVGTHVINNKVKNKQTPPLPHVTSTSSTTHPQHELLLLLLLDFAADQQYFGASLWNTTAKSK